MRNGYYVRYDIDLTGESGATHRIDVLCESPKDKILGFRLVDKLGETAQTSVQVSGRGADERGKSADHSKRKNPDELGFARVIAAMAASFDIHAKAFLLVREGELGKIGADLANQNGMVLLKDE